jgi:hypothetical protein
MQRYNIFNLIHKGLRASLYQTALQLQQTDFSIEEETEDALNKVREIIMLFEGHAHKEDSFILPAIREYEPSVVACFESEHETDEALGDQLRSTIELITIASPSDRVTMGASLTESFVSFMVFNLNHMAKEEDILNKLLWRYYSDDEIKSIGQQISSSTPPWIQEFYATWMLRGINNSEATTWMQAIEKGTPPVVFRTLLKKASEELPERRFKQVQRELSDFVIS